MIFDKFCGIIERHFPELTEIANDCKLFIFDKKPHESLKKNAQNEYFEMQDLFILPFPTIAVEDPASLIIIQDTEENQIGLNGKRRFIEIMPWALNEDAFAEDERYPRLDKAEMARQMGIDLNTGCVINVGDISDFEFHDRGIRIHGGVDFVTMCDHKKVLNEIDCKYLPQDQAEYVNKNVMRNVITAFEELLTIYTKSSFVLEESVVKEQKSKKILRSHQRPKYTILTPKEIRSKMRIERADSGEKRNSPMPHERRRHPRRLTVASGYKEDKIIIIPATWIGESEKIVGNKRYRVRLDV